MKMLKTFLIDSLSNYELLLYCMPHKTTLRLIFSTQLGATSPVRAEKVVDTRATSAPSDCCDLLSRAGFSSQLPVIVLDSRGKEVPDEPKIGGIMCTCGAPGIVVHVRIIEYM